VPECDPLVDRDGGFTLIEVVVSLLLLAIVSTAALGLFVRSMSAGDLQGQRQQAVELANLQLETVRAIPPSSLLGGRTQMAVDALWAAPGVVDTSQSAEVWDATATASSTQTVPTVKTVTLNSVVYTIKTFIDKCYEVSSGGSCGPTQTSGSTAMFRASVGVTWSPGRNQTCATGNSCGYVATTLIDASSDPTFNSN
jgi:prepilin-type N-terminal cleavage/methylation domain-containing protein